MHFTAFTRTRLHTTIFPISDESDVYIGFDASELSKIMVELQSRLDHRADQS